MHLLNINDEKDALHNIIACFKHQPSIIDIEQKGFTDTFDFTKLFIDLPVALNKLDHTISTTGVNIKLLKDNSNIFAPIFTNIFNSS